MTAYSRELDKFAAYDAQVLGISVDSTWSHIAWQEKEIGKLNYPLLSDFYPHGEIARKYDVFREGNPIPGINERAIYIVDKTGKIVFAQLYELGESPDNQDVMDALERLAGGRGAKDLTVDASDNAQGFFAKRGYIAKQRNTVTINGEWLANTTMQKTLDSGGAKP